jgi:hypothetical protein
MSGNHRMKSEPSKARVGIAGAITAGALLLAPVGAAVMAPAGVANAAPVSNPDITARPQPIFRFTFHILSKPKVPPRQQVKLKGLPKQQVHRTTALAKR